MMDRRTRAEWMRLLNGELSKADADELREQIRSRPELEAAFLDLERRWQALELPPAAPAPPGFADRVTAMARREADRTVAPAWWIRTVAGKVATAGVLAGGIVVGAVLASPGASEEWSGYLVSEPSMAESYLSGLESSDLEGWADEEPEDAS